MPRCNSAQVKRNVDFYFQMVNPITQASIFQVVITVQQCEEFGPAYSKEAEFTKNILFSLLLTSNNFWPMFPFYTK